MYNHLKFEEIFPAFFKTVTELESVWAKHIGRLMVASRRIDLWPVMM